jgi:hypothetical protein
MQQITHYKVGWNPNTNKGGINIFVKASKKAHVVPINSANELCAVMAVLKESPVFLAPNGSIYSGWEPVNNDF